MSTQVLVQEGTATFPRLQGEVEELVKAHLKIESEPLLLALYYNPHHDPQDVYLLEVLDGFGLNRVAEEREFFEVAFPSSKDFPIQPGSYLHLVLTNPVELEAAAVEKWGSYQEIRDAVAHGRYRVVFSSNGNELLNAFGANVDENDA